MGNVILSFEGDRNGIGKARFLNGSVYTGEFKDRRRNGKGEVIYYNGTKYVGEFKDDMKNGYGTMFYSNGKIMFTGMWKDGLYVYDKKIYKYRDDDYVGDDYYHHHYCNDEDGDSGGDGD